MRACYLEMSPQYHSASCRAMLLLKLLDAAGVGVLTGLGGRAGRHKGKFNRCRSQSHALHRKSFFRVGLSLMLTLLASIDVDPAEDSY